VPIIIDAHTYNEFIQPDCLFIRASWDLKKKDEKKRIEMHRQEFTKNMNYVNLEIGHNRKTVFPYNAMDLALYLHLLYS